MSDMVESLILYIIKLVAILVTVVIAIIMNEREEKKNDKSK